ncbi:MAG: heavy-metal-associated domain-containing protein [Bacteroidota bacterium]
MNTRFILILSVLFFLPGLAMSQTGTAKAGEQVSTDSTTTIAIPTIQCGMCATSVKKALGAVDGVRTSDVDRSKKTVTVSYDASKATVAVMEKAINEAGYDANTSKANPEAYEKLDDCCKIK